MRQIDDRLGSYLREGFFMTDAWAYREMNAWLHACLHVELNGRLRAPLADRIHVQLHGRLRRQLDELF